MIAKEGNFVQLKDRRQYRRGTDVLAILPKSGLSFCNIGRFCNNKK